MAVELPVSQKSYQPDSRAFWRAVCDAHATLASTCVQGKQIGAAMVFCHPQRPGVRAANGVQFDPQSSEMTPAAFPQMLDDAMAVYAAAGVRCEVVMWRWPDVPSWADEALRQRGYQPQQRTVLALKAHQAPAAAPDTSMQVVSARSLYAQLRAFYEHQARREHHASDELAAALAMTWLDFLDEPRLEMFVARTRDGNIASAGTLGMGQTAVLVPAWCDPAWRGKGVARGLVNQVIAFCARAQFAHVLLDRASDCWSIPFYESLGFGTVATGVKYKPASAG